MAARKSEQESPIPYPRKDTTVWQPGAYYHIYNRGIARTPLFRAEDNFLYVIEKARFYCKKYDLSMIAFSLMWNHYHFCARQDGDHPAGLLPQRIFNGYSKAYNNRYGHSGTLFERRFQAKRIESDEHLLHLCRYIHANPVMAGYVDDPASWPYSNYLDWVHERDGSLIDLAFIRDRFGSGRAYVAFLMDYIRTGRRKEDAELFVTVTG